MVRIPYRARRSSPTGPTPHRNPTGRGRRNAFSVPGATSSIPSGLATRLAILARCFVVAPPTEMGRSTRVSQQFGCPRRSFPVPRRGASLPDVEEGFIDRNGLDQRGETGQYFHDRAADVDVVVETGRHHHEAGTKSRAVPMPMGACTPNDLAS